MAANLAQQLGGAPLVDAQVSPLLGETGQSGGGGSCELFVDEGVSQSQDRTRCRHGKFPAAADFFLLTLEGWRAEATARLRPSLNMMAEKMRSRD
jgi:hypothetical protein